MPIGQGVMVMQQRAGHPTRHVCAVTCYITDYRTPGGGASSAICRASIDRSS
jgi:hypothetical protein